MTSNKIRLNFGYLGLLGAVLVAGFGASAARAQSALATLTGQVFDPSEKLVPAADVRATNTDTRVVTSVKTNASGIYLLSGLQPGRYTVTVDKPGFQQFDLTGLTLEVADHATRNFHVKLGSASETVTVEANGQNINTADGTVSTVISRDFIDQIPLNGRTLQNLLPLSPGIVPDAISSSNPGASGFSVNGTRDTASVNFTVDGISGNIGATPNNSAPSTLAPGLTLLGTTQSLISLDALQEFRISTSSYGVEYGVAPGAQIQLSSRAGSNRFHGSVYDYVRNTIFDANNWFANQSELARAPEQQNDFGGTVGGPIWIPHLFDGKDKAFFFFSFEDLHLLEPVVSTGQPTPTAAYRQSAPAALQPYLNAFPAPTPGGMDYGNGWAAWNTSFSQPSLLYAWSIRGDYALAKSTKVFVRMNDAPSNGTSLDDAYQTVFRVNDITTTLGVTSTFTSSLANDFRFNFSHSLYESSANLLPSSYGGNPGPATAALTPPSQYIPQGSGYYSNIVVEDDSLPGAAVLLLDDQASRLRQWDLVDGLKWQVGRHLFKFGGEWNRQTAIQDPVAYEQDIFFYELTSVAASTADEVDVGSQPYVTDSHTTRSALYAGDTWKMTPRLSVDYGVRWELPFPTYFNGPYQPLYISAIADPNNPTITQGRTQWPMTWHNFAPRLGIAYEVHDNNQLETVIRAGGGLFYSTQLAEGIGTVAYPDSAYSTIYSVPFPVAPSLLVPPQTGVVTPDGLANNSLVGVSQHLAVPRVWQWNAALEQKFGANQSLTLSYVASAGRRLFFFPAYYPPTGTVEAYNFAGNNSQSDYNSLQVKFDRHMTRGLQTMASYTWSHSIDDVSTDDFQYQPLWGNSDFDTRHAFSLAFVYNIPGPGANRAVRQVTSGWEAATNFQARTGLPTTELFASSGFLPNGTLIYAPAYLVPGVPVYLHGNYPGGTKLNRAAFSKTPVGGPMVSRNEFRNPGFWQEDFSLQRKFVIGEKWGLLRARVDAFNIFNHPNFAGYFVRNLTTSSLFGQATSMANNFGAADPIYNSGGPRSLQLSLRYEF